MIPESVNVHFYIRKYFVLYIKYVIIWEKDIIYIDNIKWTIN
jgi:hypothetical protein